MTGFLMFVHAIICLILVCAILMQSGRGGGLTENFSSAESMFGAQTNEFMVKITTIFCCIFFVTCTTLAVLSARKEQSVMGNRFAAEAPVMPQTTVPDEVPQAVTDVQGAAQDAVDAVK